MFPLRPFVGRLATPVPAIFLLLGVLSNPASAQFGGMKRKMMKGAVCGGAAIGGYKLGSKVAEFEAKKLKLPPEEAAKHRRAFQIGMALAFCGGGAALTGTIYEKLSKRDIEARNEAMEAALVDAEPSTHTYVLPDSGYQGNITTEVVEPEGKKECRTTVDRLAEADEPAMARYCRKPPDGKWEVAVDVF